MSNEAQNLLEAQIVEEGSLTTVDVAALTKNYAIALAMPVRINFLRLTKLRHITD